MTSEITTTIETRPPKLGDYFRVTAITVEDGESSVVLSRVDDLGGITDAQVEEIYAALDPQIGNEARTIEGKRAIVAPLIEGVVRALRRPLRTGPTYGHPPVSPEELGRTGEPT